MWEMNGAEWLDAIHRHYDRTWTLPVHVACESEPSADLGFFRCDLGAARRSICHVAAGGPYYQVSRYGAGAVRASMGGD